MGEKNLVIKFSETSVVFTEVSLLEGESLSTDLLTVPISLFGTKTIQEQLPEDFSSIKNNNSFKDILLVWQSNKTSFLPMQLFEESNLKALSNLVFGKDSSFNDMDFNRIPELSLVNIFNFPLKVKSFTIKNFPFCTMKAESMAFLRGINQKGIFKRSLHVRVYQNSIAVEATGRGELIFHNVFQYETPDDIAYYLINTFEKLKIDFDGGVVLYPFNKELEEFCKEVEGRLIKILKNIKSVEVKSSNELNQLYLSCV